MAGCTPLALAWYKPDSTTGSRDNMLELFRENFLLVALLVVSSSPAHHVQAQAPIKPATVYHQGAVTIVSPNQPGWMLVRSSKTETLFEKRSEIELLNAGVKTFKTKVFETDKELLVSLENMKDQELSKLKRDSLHFYHLQFRATPCVQYDGIFTGDASAANFQYFNFKGYLCRQPGTKDIVIQMELTAHTNHRGFTESLHSLSQDFFEKVVLSNPSATTQ